MDGIEGLATFNHEGGGCPADGGAADRVIVQKQHFADRLTAQAIVPRHQRVRTADETVCGGAVARQIDQVAARSQVRIFAESGL
jgi:hypothetical protein